MVLSDFDLVRLDEGMTLSDFDCGNPDLNDFLKGDALLYLKQLMAVTYLLNTQDHIAAFFTFQNDKISFELARKSDWNAVSRTVSNEKRNRKGGYPAVKIGRFGVDLRYKSKGLGTQILDYTKMSFTTNNKTGCRFITVDAYPEAVGFYEKNGFKTFPSEKESDDTRGMYFDLFTFI